MTKLRDDKRANMRRDFALWHASAEDYEPAPVGSFWIGHADGCSEQFSERGQGLAADYSETHEPGTHAELHRILVDPRRRLHGLEPLAEVSR